MSLSRRDLLRAAALGAGGLAVRSVAAPLRLGDSELLPDPDFSRLRAASPFVVGVRPHRRGGVRLELEPAPLDGPGGKKLLVHNYGHGGGGITLSWGCAAVAADLVGLAQRRLGGAVPSVAVLGLGAIGLTTATELRRRFPGLALRVYAQDLDPRSTTSFIAGGQFEPSGIFHEYEGAERRKLFGSWLRRSRDRIVELQREGKGALFGIADRRDFTLDHENLALDAFTPHDVVAPYVKGPLPFGRLNVVGREYRTWLMNPTVLLPRLVAELRAQDVPFVQRRFAGLRDVAALPENIVVNCTGYGARQLFGDAQLVPQRGHLVILQRTSARHDYFFSGGCGNPVVSYVFCRQDDIVVGGSVHPGNDRAEVQPRDGAEFQRILGNARTMFEGRPDACRA